MKEIFTFTNEDEDILSVYYNQKYNIFSISITDGYGKSSKSINLDQQTIIKFFKTLVDSNTIPQ